MSAFSRINAEIYCCLDRIESGAPTIAQLADTLNGLRAAETRTPLASSGGSWSGTTNWMNSTKQGDALSFTVTVFSA
jgi:hypothetical protein